MQLTFINISRAVMRLSAQFISASDSIVLWNICERADWGSWTLKISVKALTSLTRGKLSEKTVQRSLQALVDVGLISRERRLSAYGEIVPLITVHARRIMDLYLAQEGDSRDRAEEGNINDFAVGHSVPPLGHNVPPPGHNVPSSGHSVSPPGHNVPSSGHSVSPISVYSVLPSVPSVEDSVLDSSESEPLAETPRAEPEPEPAHLAETQSPSALAWRTIEREIPEWQLDKAYYQVLSNLGYKGRCLAVGKIVKAARVHPSVEDIQAFLAQTPH